MTRRTTTTIYKPIKLWMPSQSNLRPLFTLLQAQLTLSPVVSAGQYGLDAMKDIIVTKIRRNTVDWHPVDWLQVADIIYELHPSDEELYLTYFCSLVVTLLNGDQEKVDAVTKDLGNRIEAGGPLRKPSMDDYGRRLSSKMHHKPNNLPSLSFDINGLAHDETKTICEIDPTDNSRFLYGCAFHDWSRYESYRFADVPRLLNTPGPPFYAVGKDRADTQLPKVCEANPSDNSTFLYGTRSSGLECYRLADLPFLITSPGPPFHVPCKVDLSTMPNPGIGGAPSSSEGSHFNGKNLNSTVPAFRPSCFDDFFRKPINNGIPLKRSASVPTPEYEPPSPSIEYLDNDPYSWNDPCSSSSDLKDPTINSSGGLGLSGNSWDAHDHTKRTSLPNKSYGDYHKEGGSTMERKCPFCLDKNGTGAWSLNDVEKKLLLEECGCAYHRSYLYPLHEWMTPCSVPSDSYRAIYNNTANHQNGKSYAQIHRERGTKDSYSKCKDAKAISCIFCADWDWTGVWRSCNDDEKMHALVGGVACDYHRRVFWPRREGEPDFLSWSIANGKPTIDHQDRFKPKPDHRPTKPCPRYIRIPSSLIPVFGSLSNLSTGPCPGKRTCIAEEHPYSKAYHKGFTDKEREKLDAQSGGVTLTPNCLPNTPQPDQALRKRADVYKDRPDLHARHELASCNDIEKGHDGKSPHGHGFEETLFGRRVRTLSPWAIIIFLIGICVLMSNEIGNRNDGEALRGELGGWYGGDDGVVFPQLDPAAPDY
ncbi:MAG: hypothetical protein Q9209_005987 [Squamulea sp. 1 TL-2023]